MSIVNQKIGGEIQTIASSLLESGEVAAFLGYTKGSLPGMMRPYVARDSGEAGNLSWSSFCVINLANYLPALLRSVEPPRRPNEPPPEGQLPKVGVVATGCWSRNMVVQVQENQIDRSRVVIVGVSSRGMVDRRKVERLVGNREITAIEEEDNVLIVRGKGFEETINRWDAVRDNCKTCLHPDPVIYDELAGGLSGDRQIPDRFHEVEEIEALSVDERWKWFQEEISSCLRCYACRNVCPLCYCPTCFVDDSRPQWVGKSTDEVDTALFHILRAYHCAGRCTDCGSCESACPMGIRMRLFTKKLQKDVIELYGFEPGLEADAPLPLSTYKVDDPEDFIITAGKKGDQK